MKLEAVNSVFVISFSPQNCSYHYMITGINRQLSSTNETYRLGEKRKLLQEFRLSKT